MYLFLLPLVAVSLFLFFFYQRLCTGDCCCLIMIINCRGCNATTTSTTMWLLYDRFLLCRLLHVFAVGYYLQLHCLLTMLVLLLLSPKVSSFVLLASLLYLYLISIELTLFCLLLHVCCK
jgi:hypothetical protein